MIPEKEENPMRTISKWSFQTGAAVLIATLLLGLFAVQAARADLILDDPAITLGYRATPYGTNAGTETTNTWSLTGPLPQSSGSYYYSFLNNTGSAWTTLEIVANYPTAGKLFTAYVSPSTANLGGYPTTQTAFSVGIGAGVIPPGTTANTVTFDFSGPPAVPNGDYLVFGYTNWQGSGTLTSFNFTANGGADPPTVPEPATLLLLGCGLLGFVGLRKKIKK